MSDEDVPVRVRLRGDRVLRRNRGEEDRGLLLRPLRQQPEGRRREHGRAAEAAFPEEGERRRIRGRVRRPIVRQHQLRPAEIAQGRDRPSDRGVRQRASQTAAGKRTSPSEADFGPFFCRARKRGAIGKFSPFTFRSHASSSKITLYRADTNTPAVFICLESPSVGGYSGGPIFDLGMVHIGMMTSSQGPTRLIGIMHGTISDQTGGKIALFSPASFLKDLV